MVLLALFPRVMLLVPLMHVRYYTVLLYKYFFLSGSVDWEAGMLARVEISLFCIYIVFLVLLIIFFCVTSFS